MTKNYESLDVDFGYRTQNYEDAVLGHMLMTLVETESILREHGFEKTTVEIERFADLGQDPKTVQLEVDVQYPENGINVILTEIDGENRQPVIDFDITDREVTSVHSHDVIRCYKPDDVALTFEKVMFEQVHNHLDLSNDLNDLKEEELQK